jgi:hypothetical protein
MVDERNGFVAWSQKIGDTQSPGNGMVLRDGVLELVNWVTVKSEYGDTPYYPTAMRVSMTTESGEQVEASGSVFHNVPLRNRRDGEVARLAEVIMKIDYQGATGYGICEYHDRMVDGIPAGMNEV